MTNKNKGDKGNKDKDKVEWQLALDFQEKKLLEGMKDACSSMSENLKLCIRTELSEVKNEINEVKKELEDVTHKIQHLESKGIEKDRVVQKLKQQNKEMQTSKKCWSVRL